MDPPEGAFTSAFRLAGAVSVTLARRENVPGCIDQLKEVEEPSSLLPSLMMLVDGDENESDGFEFADDDGDVDVDGDVDDDGDGDDDDDGDGDDD